STIVFALCGGEEAGMPGSKYFVEHFPDIDRVALLLQADRAYGSPILFPTLDFADGSAPEWLVKASYEEIARLGHSGLHFPTDFFTFMSAMPGGGVGSDHEPFLTKGIPAIDFTSDARDPIHTPQDNFNNFHVSGLKRTGDLLYALVERFDGGVPDQKTGQYFLYEVATFPVFVPLWMLDLFIVLTLVVGTVVLVNVRKRREIAQGSEKRKVPALKMFLLMLVIQACVWLSENIVALIKGVRYPWLLDINGYYVLGFFAASIGIWISLQLTPRLRLRHDGYSYFLRAFVFLVIFVGISALLSTKLALYPATALFLLSLAMFVRQPILKLLFWFLSPHFMFRLFFTELFDFIARLMHLQPEITPHVNTAQTFAFVLFFSVWSFPFLLGFAAVYFDSKVDLLWLTKLRSVKAGIVVAVLFGLTVLVLASRESYSQEWKPSIWIEQSFSSDSTNGTLKVRSSEYLDGIRLSFVGKDTLISNETTEVEMPKSLPLPAEPWISVDRKVTTSPADSGVSVDVLLSIHLKYRPYKLKLDYSSRNTSFRDVVSPYALGMTDRAITIQWSAFPDSSLTIPLRFSIAAGDSVIVRERIEAIFLQEGQPISIETKRSSPVIRRSTFVHNANITPE
ncbi:MAG: M28 family peptidase, partial [bacterium]